MAGPEYELPPPEPGRRSGALDRDSEINQSKVAMVTMLGVVWVDPTTGERIEQ